MTPGSAQTPPSGAPAMVACPISPEPRGWRVFLFFTSALVLTGLVSMLFADLLWRTGWSASRTFLLELFVVLFFFAAIGCMNGIYGFVLRLFGDPYRITRLEDYRNRSIAGTSTALVFPIYNEDVSRVYAGLRATYESLRETGELERFDFFILSDSTDVDKWVEEERRWFDLVRDLKALGRVYYRRRVSNVGKKSGNVRDFLNNWGRRYRYFIVFDADSVMRGETIVNLVKLMEAHPGAGLIQTMPGLVNAQSLFGRMQQFANRLYAPVFISGLNYWAQNAGNYWGHNAIIRTEPFMHCCDLPQLPGRRPFGGYILSHDFVEAALMLKEGWQVWFAYDLPGSYEEAPQAMIESAQRDRRWCQGNLQHSMVLFAHGLRGVSRIHLLLGIFGYLTSPFWLLFLLTFHWMRWYHTSTGLSDITTAGFTPYLDLSGTQHALLVFGLCMIVLLLPKVLSLAELLFDAERRKAFGGLLRSTLGAVLETIFSTLHAPLLMLWHSRFVVTILLGRTVNWGTQNREADGTAWSFAIRRHWGHTLIGVVWGALIWWRLDAATFWWFTPLLAGMVLSVPLSVYTSRCSLGLKSRALGLFLTPEEKLPPPELVSLRSSLAFETETPGRRAEHSGLAQAVLDPYVNAIHVSLLREKKLNPVYAESLAKMGVGRKEVRTLGETMLKAGPDAISPEDKVLILNDAEVMAWLHRLAWLRPGKVFAPWWQEQIRRYSADFAYF